MYKFTDNGKNYFLRKWQGQGVVSNGILVTKGEGSIKMWLEIQVENTSCFLDSGQLPHSPVPSV